MRNEQKQRSRLGISLIETLVVLCIIALLLGLLFPAVHAVREEARGASCKNNLHQLVVALEQYRTTRKKFPKPAKANSVGGWAIAVLPFLGDEPLGDGLAGEPSINQPSISLLIAHRPAIMTCPAGWEGDSNIPGVAASHYASLPIFLEIGDLPVTTRIPWVESPYLNSQPRPVGKGPHWGGYYFAKYAEDSASGNVAWISGDSQN
jgi:type II secretory pathway pseudopilin PulG